jgi:hypothetical protein
MRGPAGCWIMTPRRQDTLAARERRTRRQIKLATGLCVLATLATLAAGLLTGCRSSDNATTTLQGTGTSPTQSAPGGAPGDTGAGAPGASPGGDSSAVYPSDAVYTQAGDTKSEDGKTYTASEDDRSAILVSDGGWFTLTNAQVETSGDGSNNDSSSLYGLNAAVVAVAGCTIDMSDSSITTTGSGATGAFATGESAWVTLTNVVIEATGEGGHGVMATQGGSVTLDNVTITTAGADAAPLATAGSSGVITATGGNAFASGSGSPALYSTGVITVNGGTYRATGAEAAVIEGANSIALNDVDLSSTFADRWGIMLYQRMSGGAEGSEGTFTMKGGSLSLTAGTGPLFCVTNSKGAINLTGVKLTCASGILVKAAAAGWGASGSNGGTAVLAAQRQTLNGDLVADNLSSISLSLANSSRLQGAIDAAGTAARAGLELDKTSTWIVTADSYLTSLTLTDGVFGTIIPNIVGNGYTVYYDATDPASAALAGRTFSLTGGGTLQPRT